MIGRIIDANTNRVCEGIRVIEDYFRFVAERRDIIEVLRSARHRLRAYVPGNVIKLRDSERDIGKALSAQTTLDQRLSIRDVLNANFGRVQEGARGLEEYYKLIGQYHDAKDVEQIRYQMYTIQKQYAEQLFNGVYAITPTGNRDEILSHVLMLLNAGVRTIQYRDKWHDADERLAIANELRQITNRYGALLIINDYLDLALACHADGLHVGQTDLTVESVKSQAPKLIVGLSTHNKEQFMRALTQHIDYVAIGPIFPTQSKTDTSPVVGVEFAKWARGQTDLPIVAIGGINQSNIDQLISLKINSCAMISSLTEHNTVSKLVNIYKL